MFERSPDAHDHSAPTAVGTATDLAEAEAEIAAAATDLARLAAQAPPPVIVSAPVAPRPIARGDRITVRGLAQAGEALSAPDDRGEFDIQLGALRMRIKAEQVERVERESLTPATRTPALTLPPRAASPGLELEVRGQRAEDALPLIEAYLQNAFMAGLPWVRIIHGKGTGALRRVVREALAQSPLVSEFETAEPRAGGEGVTIAKLAV